MRAQSLKARILFASFFIIFIFAVSMLILGAGIIKNDIIARAQRQVKSDLRVSRSIFQGEIDAIKTAFNLIPLTNVNLDEIRQKMNLDYLYIVSKEEQYKVKSEIVQTAFSGRAIGGIRIIGKDELAQMGEDIYQKAEIEVRPTLKSHPSDKTVLEQAMAIGYAMPLFDKNGQVKNVVYGGKIINRDFQLVDKIRDLVFEDNMYDSKPLGTVTIFLDDIRIATNVLDKGGNRAIGTVVSDIVYKNVVVQGKIWLDRAFVVTDWYLTAYEPIKNINGQIIGIFYVGILEKPFKDLEKRIFLGFLTIVSLMAGLSAVLSYILANAVTQPVTRVLEATTKIARGDLNHRIAHKSNIQELNRLAESFNDMAKTIHDWERKLTISNKELVASNKNYLDLVGFVSHELKGVLGSSIINVYSLKDGYLGELNPIQKKAIDSTSRTLDHFENMVKNYLDFSRIEKNELDIKLAEMDLKKNVIMPSIEGFERQSREKNVKINNFVADGIKIKADNSLLLVVCNNLLGNAIKYGFQGGSVNISAQEISGQVQVSFYNDGIPIKEEEKAMLFKKFSRLLSASEIKGTGLGLFITKEIIEKHGGKIWLQSHSNGNEFIFSLKKF